MAQKIIQEIKRLIRDREKEKESRENSSELFRLNCEICKGGKVKFSQDFEQWEKDLFAKQHLHKVRRFVKEVIKKWTMMKKR